MFKFHDHIQINLSQDTVCGEPLDSIILRHSDTTSITLIGSKEESIK